LGGFSLPIIDRKKMSTDTQLQERISIKVSPPKKFKVIFLNDDSTPMEHVIHLLIGIFGHDESSATNVTLEIHNTGSGVAGVYSFEIAEQKAIEATNISRAASFPLKIQVEEE